MFRDAESGRSSSYVDPASARAEYLRRFGEHAAEVKKACADLGIEYRPGRAPTGRSNVVLFDLLKARDAARPVEAELGEAAERDRGRAMSFLAPLYLLGALAIAGPILFHLIRRTPGRARSRSAR